MTGSCEPCLPSTVGASHRHNKTRSTIFAQDKNIKAQPLFFDDMVRPLSALELVPGRSIVVASAEVLERCLAEAQLLQKARDEGALRTLISLFADQPATVLEAPVGGAGSERAMAKIKTFVGTTAALPVGALGPNPEEERRMRLRFERSVVHDLAAVAIVSAWRLGHLRHNAKRELGGRRAERSAKLAEEREAALRRQRGMVELLAATTLQAFARGCASRRKQASWRAAAEAAHHEEARDGGLGDVVDPATAAVAATALSAAYRGSSTRRRQQEALAAAEAQISQAVLDSGEGGDEAFLKACASGDLHAAHALFRDHGVGVHGSDPKGNSGLMLASAGGHLDTVRFLASVGASLTLPNLAGWTPLHRACFNGHADVASFLVKAFKAQPARAAALAATNHFGSTALHVAIPNGHAEVVELLLSCGAPLEARNASGDTPLHFSVVCRQPALTAAFLRAGADRDAANNEGRTPLDSARATEQPEVMALLSGPPPAPLRPDLHRALSGYAGVGGGRPGPDVTAGKENTTGGRRRTSTGEKAKSKAKTSRRSEAGPIWDDSDARALGRALEGTSAGPGRRALVGEAWRAASDELCGSLALRAHEAATVLHVLGVLVSPPPKEADAPADVLVRLDCAEHTTQDLTEAARRLAAPGPGITLKQGRTARKKLLALVRCPRGAASFVAERSKPVPSWTAGAGRALLGSKLEVPDATLRRLRCDGVSLLALDAESMAADPHFAALPSILLRRLAFHCELLRHLAAAEAAAEAAGAEAGAEAGAAETGASKASVASAIRRGAQETSVVGTGPGGAVEDWATRGGVEGGAVEGGLRVQVAHLADLARAMAPPGRSTLLPAELPLARRVAGARGTVISGEPDLAGRVAVALDEGLEARLPTQALYAVPDHILPPHLLRVGTPAAVVGAAWLRQLLLASNGDLVGQGEAMAAVDALAERLGGAKVRVAGLERLARDQRVRVAAADGFESSVPAEALVPPSGGTDEALVPPSGGTDARPPLRGAASALAQAAQFPGAPEAPAQGVRSLAGVPGPRPLYRSASAEGGPAKPPAEPPGRAVCGRLWDEAALRAPRDARGRARARPHGPGHQLARRPNRPPQGSRRGGRPRWTHGAALEAQERRRRWRLLRLEPKAHDCNAARGQEQGRSFAAQVGGRAAELVDPRRSPDL